MKFDVITLFPKMFESPFAESIIGRAIKNKLVEINFHDLRKWAWNKYGAVDDRPFGGDVGMLIRVDVIDKALKEVVKDDKTKVILTSARGKKFNQQMAEDWSKLDNIVFICGHYEGFDERVSTLVDEEVSIGDYVLTGGEVPAMVMMDAVARLIPGVLGKDVSSIDESWSEKEIDGKKIRTIEPPQYTRPREFNGLSVPEELLSGDPKIIKKWQRDNTNKD
jgi:tRNA (guanine37-N1)-methyltransferase